MAGLAFDAAGWLAILRTAEGRILINPVESQDNKRILSTLEMLAIPVLDGCSHSHEGLLDIDGVFRTRLHEWDAHLISKRLNGVFNQL